jgi:hypothetical protein
MLRELAISLFVIALFVAFGVAARRVIAHDDDPCVCASLPACVTAARAPLGGLP